MDGLRATGGGGGFVDGGVPEKEKMYFDSIKQN